MNTLWMIPVFVMSIVAHELAHGYAAKRLGDTTAEEAGRLTWNPISHLELFGALAFFIIGFGWAKPIPVDSSRFQDPKKGMLIVSLAGPAANFVISFGAIILLALTAATATLTPNLAEFLFNAVVLNAVLGTFNLLPVPPLDGSRLLTFFLPEKLWNQAESATTALVGVIVIIGASKLGVLDGIFSFIIDTCRQLVNLVV